MMKRLVVLPILALALVVFAPHRAYACGGAGQACCSGPTCTAPAFCDASNICVLPDRQACTSNSDCATGVCAGSSLTPSCGSMECFSDVGQGCTADADCEPGTWCFTTAEGGTNKCTLDSVATTGSCAIDGRNECVTFLCDSMTQTCEKSSPPSANGCFTNADCETGMMCCQNGVMGCTDSCTNNESAGWCCVPSGHGTCTVGDELTFCCSGSCNGGTGICN